MTRLDAAYNLVRDIAAEGGTVLFVGTKRQARLRSQSRPSVAVCPMSIVRWLGGTLTNWRTIRQRIDKLHELETRRELGVFEELTKREALRCRDRSTI